MQRPLSNGHKFPFGCGGYVTAVAAGQSQRFYSGVGIFNWFISVRLLRSHEPPGAPLNQRDLYVTAIPQRPTDKIARSDVTVIYVTAVAAGQSQRFYSGVGIFNWYYLSSPPQILRRPAVHLEPTLR